MECHFCGCEPADPTSLRPVREVIAYEGDDLNAAIEHGKLGNEDHATCEDCYPEVSEPERMFRLRHEDPVSWQLPEERIADDQETALSLLEAPTTQTLGEQIAEDTCERHEEFCCPKCFNMEPVGLVILS